MVHSLRCSDSFLPKSCFTIAKHRCFRGLNNDAEHWSQMNNATFNWCYINKLYHVGSESSAAPWRKSQSCTLTIQFEVSVFVRNPPTNVTRNFVLVSVLQLRSWSPFPVVNIWMSCSSILFLKTHEENIRKYVWCSDNMKHSLFPPE